MKAVERTEAYKGVRNSNTRNGVKNEDENAARDTVAQYSIKINKNANTNNDSKT